MSCSVLESERRQSSARSPESVRSLTPLPLRSRTKPTEQTQVPHRYVENCQIPNVPAGPSAPRCRYARSRADRSRLRWTEYHRRTAPATMHRAGANCRLLTCCLDRTVSSVPPNGRVVNRPSFRNPVCDRRRHLLHRTQKMGIGFALDVKRGQSGPRVGGGRSKRC
jgi:hypothetical protein